jgi:hypothetical protein
MLTNQADTIRSLLTIPLVRAAVHAGQLNLDKLLRDRATSIDKLVNIFDRVMLGRLHAQAKHVACIHQRSVMTASLQAWGGVKYGVLHRVANIHEL